MRLNDNLQVPAGTSGALARFLFDTLQAIVRKVNGMSDGRLYATDAVATVAPTTGTWARGDFVRNSAPSETGSASSKYVVIGWICTVAGTPGTWLQVRTLTGN
jgi:hypothetical protein